MALKSKHTVDNETGVLTLHVTSDDADNPGEFSRSVNLRELFGSAAGLMFTALAFAARTALRNATGGREIDEAEAAVDARIAAWQKGEWGAERGAGDGEVSAFTPGHVLAKAVQRVYSAKFADGAAAAEALCTMLQAQLEAAGKGAFADLDEESQKKARNAFVRAVREKDAAVNSAIAAIQAEQATARAAKTAAKAGSAGASSLF